MSSFWFKPRSKHAFFHDFRGNESTYFEAATICGFGMFVAANLFYETEKECNEQDITMRPWQKALFLYCTFDISAGALANLSTLPSNYVDSNNLNNAKLNEIGAAFSNGILLLGTYFSCKSYDEKNNDKEWNKSLYIFLRNTYLSQVIGSSLTIYFWEFKYHHLIGWISTLLLAGNIILNKKMKRKSLKYLMCLYCVKLHYTIPLH